MVYAGDSINNPVLGMTMKFIKTHRETNGTGWQTQITLETGKGKDRLPHCHIQSNETFKILQGKGRYWFNGTEKDVKAGDEIFLPARIQHIHPWNTGTTKLVMENTVVSDGTQPPDSFAIEKAEDFFEYNFYLAREGKVNKKGNPNILQSAVFLRAIRKTIVLGKIPVFVQDLVFIPMAIVGRMLGYKRKL